MNTHHLFILAIFSLMSFSINAQNLDGKVCTIVNVANGKSLSVVGRDLGKNGGKVHSWPLNPNGNRFQEWRFIAKGDGYHIVNVSPQTRKSNYLELSSHEIGKNGGRVQLWDNHFPDHLNKIWKLTKNSDGSYSLATASRSDFVLELSSNDLKKKGGGKIQMWKNHGYDNQKWWIKIKE